MSRYWLDDEAVAVARAVYAAAGAKPGEMLYPSVAALLIFGSDTIRETNDRAVFGYTGREYGVPIIFVRADMPRAAREVTIGHELGHIFRAKLGFKAYGAAEEDACDRVGAALVDYPAAARGWRRAKKAKRA
jgi:hypothetical protein